MNLDDLLYNIFCDQSIKNTYEINSQNVIALCAAVSAFFSAYYARTAIKQNRYQSKKLLEQQNEIFAKMRLTEMSQQWNSLDYIRARNHISALIPENIGEYPQFYIEANIQTINDMSLIAHFFVKIVILKKYYKILDEPFTEEYFYFIEYWTKILIPIYYIIKGEERIVRALENLRREAKLHTIIIPEALPRHSIKWRWKPNPTS